MSAFEGAAPVSVSPPLAIAATSKTKRLFDITLTLLILLFVLPLLIVTALCVIAESRGPVLFVQRRTGLNGETIRVFKFRSMTVLEDEGQIRHAARGDNRVTKVGRFIRRSSIDELPQLFNVLKGEMSLVGPRPHALSHDQYYGALVPQYHHRFRTKPGITGLAQVSGLRGEIHSLDGMSARVDKDNAYIDDWSFWLDMTILTKTLAVTIAQTDAY